jgi:altronate hydrolase
VAVVFQDVAEGGTVEVEGLGVLTAREAIPAGHKIAVRDVPQGQPVRKYGEKIGLALADIQVGDYVHLHNLTSDRVKA